MTSPFSLICLGWRPSIAIFSTYTPPPKSHQPPSPYLINNERSLNWLIEKMCIILFTELKSIPSLNKKANRGYHKTSSEDDKAPRGMGNFHIKRKSCSYVLVVKKVVLVFVMLFSRTKSTAGTFASELTMWNEVVYYVRIDISEGRKKNSSKVQKTASGYLLEIVFILPMSLPPPPPPVLVIWESPGERKSQVFFI